MRSGFIEIVVSDQPTVPPLPGTVELWLRRGVLVRFGRDADLVVLRAVIAALVGRSSC